MMKAYLRRRLKLMAVLLAFALIFAVVLWASAVPVDAVGYASLLCAALGALVAILDFGAYCRMHRALADMRGRVSVGLEGLPAARDLIEGDWRALVEEVSQAKLEEYQKSLAEKSEMADYYTLWAHQVKTPIAAMDLMLQSPGALDERQMGAELFKIEQYVEMALGFMRLDGEGSDFAIARYPLSPVVKGAVRKYARLFILKDIHLELGDLEETALTDGKWLGFALGQLISNAVKYTPPGGRVEIYTLPGPELVVRDSGIGIRAEDLPRVFDRGYTGLTGRTDARSTGIGLYLTRRVLTALGHEITLTSQEGAGTTARIDLKSKALEVE